MKYRLALDLGTTSLGWAVFRLNDQDEPSALIRAGVRIFSDGRHPKDGSSLAVQRRDARSMRRRRDRLLKRKARMMKQLVDYGFFPADPAERKVLERQYPDPYALRAKGLQEALSPAAFARAIFHLNQRRGFKSNRRTDKADNDSGALKSAIRAVQDQLKEAGCRTVGEWLSRRVQQGEGVRARLREERVTTEEGRVRNHKHYDLYINRQMVADEFDALWAAQAAFNPVMFHDRARQALRDTLLFQRDLRPVRPGRCTLLPDEERAPLALPSSQRFRMYQEVNHLRILDEQMQEQPLTLVQRDQIIQALEKKRKLSFEQIKRLLKLGGATTFNLQDEKREELKGNATSVLLSEEKHFGPAWHDFDATRQDDIVIRLCNEENEAALVEWLQQSTGVDREHAEAIANVTLPDGYGSLSHKALVRILPPLMASVCTYSQAVTDAGFAHHSRLDFPPHDPEEVTEDIDPDTGEIVPVFKQLPYYAKVLQRHVAFGTGVPTDAEEKRYGKIANPTVHIGLNQVRKVVNTLIARYGRPREVVVELARDLKESKKRRDEIQKQQAANQKRNMRIRQEIAGIRGCHAEEVKGRDIEKWILWEELSPDVTARCCPYSGQQISARMVVSEETEIEHILPFSKTLDDSLNNKTLSMRKANRIKGNRTPWEARHDFAAAGWSYEEILARVGRMPYATKGYRFTEGGYRKWLGEDKDFLARALNDTRHLSRVARLYLQMVCPGQRVRVIPGRMTAILRRHLGLNTLLSDSGIKNRDDHRHHAVDACVIGVTDQGLLQRFAQANARASQEGLEQLAKRFEPPWPTYRQHVIRAVENILVSHRPDHGYQGSLMEDTAYGIRKDGSIRQRVKEDGSGREIKHLIRISEPGQPLRHGVDKHGNPLPYKGYVGGSNDCIEICREEDGKWTGDVISTFQAYDIVRREGLARLRHPTLAQNGKPLVMRLMIDDVLMLDESGDGKDDVTTASKLFRVVKLSGNGQIFLAPLHEANVDARNRDKNDPFKYVSKMPGSLQKSGGEQVTISPIGIMSRKADCCRMAE